MYETAIFTIERINERICGLKGLCSVSLALLYINGNNAVKFFVMK